MNRGTSSRRIATVVGLLLALAACGTGEAPPEVVPPPAPRGRPSHLVVADSAWRTIRVCVVDGEGMREVRARYNLLTGDTLVEGRPFAEAYPARAEHARNARWYVENEPITLDGRRHIKYGLPRVLGPGRAVPLGRAHHGVRLFVEAGDEPPPSGILYVPVGPACEFQSYQWDLMVGGVRG